MPSQLSLSIVLSLALSTIGATASGPASAEKKTDPSLYLCNGVSFEGSCVYYPVTSGECNAITNEFAVGKSAVMSATSGPNNVCTLFSDEGCTGDEISVDSPGNKNLGSVDWSDKARSYKCVVN